MFLHGFIEKVEKKSRRNEKAKSGEDLNKKIVCI